MIQSDAKDGTGIDPENIIAVTLDDLSEDERRGVERELDEELRRRLASYQKTRNGVVKKVVVPALPAALDARVNQLPPTGEVANLIYVSVASKFDAELARSQRTLTQIVADTVDEVKAQIKDLRDGLPHQVRSLVLQTH